MKFSSAWPPFRGLIALDFNRCSKLDALEVFICILCAPVPCLAHRSGSQEWFEEECVGWDDIQRDGIVVSSADIHTKVAAVQACARGALL